MHEEHIKISTYKYPHSGGGALKRNKRHLFVYDKGPGLKHSGSLRKLAKEGESASISFLG